LLKPLSEINIWQYSPNPERIEGLMNPLDRLSEYLRTVERKLRLLAWTRGAALTAVAALLLTVVLVLVANRYAFSENSLTASRTVLFVSLALAIGFGLLLPLLRLNVRKAAKEAENKFPEFEARLLTFAEKRREGTRDPFLELLAADTLKTAERTEPARVANPKSLFGLGTAGFVAIATLVWLGTSGPGFWGYGTSLLWAGPPRAEESPFYSISVEPGNRTVRKRSDQLIVAQPLGFTPSTLRLFAKYASASKWEETAMQPRTGQPGFELLLAGVPETMDYYVESGNVRSKTFKLNVVDLPSVRKIKVTYNYPAWSGMQPSTEDPGGDLRAIEGSTAQLEVQSDRPLTTGFLALDNGTKIPLADGKAVVPIQKDGIYYVAVTDRGEDVRLTDDYFIEARKDNAPLVRMTNPGRDAKASPIEEVPIRVEASDDFAIRNLSLVYSVNGGEPKTVALGAKGDQEAEGKYLMSLEEFKLVPGDVVSMYAIARDARNTAQTDIYFIEAQPFDREYTQAQTGGGEGGGGGGEPEKISQRQKEIIAATWNELRGRSGDPNVGKFLSEMQSKLRDQAKSLAERTRSRALAGANQEFKTFVAELDQAVQAMTPASDKLKLNQWKDALSPEQKSLQHLLRAESVFRNIQVAFGNRGGGGGGGSMGRDLENLFDLELDTEKNQYETGQQQSAGQKQKEIDEAMQKLEQLARRQQELAQQRQRDQKMTAQQRWQQEMLRREAEQLQRQMEQLSRGDQQQQQSQSSASSSSSSQGQQGQQSGQQSQQGQQGQMSRMEQMRQQMEQMRREHSPMNTQNRAQLERALERLKQATKDMQNAASNQANGTPQSEADARRAAERLQEARDMIAGMRRQEAGGQVGELADKAEKLAQQQREFQNRMMKDLGIGPDGQPRQQPGQTREGTERLASEKDRMAQDLQQLERQIQSTARDTATTDRATSTKLREALGNLQQEEIGRKMKWSSDMIRRGGTAYAYMRESTTTYALDNLKDKLREAANSMEKGGGKGGKDNLEQALRQTESVRQQMEQLARSLERQNGQRGNQQGNQQGNQRGQQPGQQGQNGQQQGQQAGGNQPGSQQGQNGQQGGQQGNQSGGNARGGSPDGRDQNYGARPDGYDGGGGGFRAMNTGERMPGGGGNYDPQAADRAFREGVRDLMRLRESLNGEAPELTKDVQDLIREMSRLDPKRFPGNPEMVERLRQQVVGGIEHLELQLRRKLDDGGGSVRLGASEPVPQGYTKSVAEYFRKLSKQ
jgi:hypothetical protein